MTKRGEPMAYLLAVLSTNPECTAGRWRYSHGADGYSLIPLDGRMHRLPRVVCEWRDGPCPPGMEACHSCAKGHLGCFSPCCLRWDTPEANHAEQRQVYGEVHGQARLTQAQVDEIRIRYAAGGVTQTRLATEFGVQQPHIHNIVHHKRWTLATRKEAPMPTHPTLTGDDLRSAIRQAARCRGTRNHRLELIPGDPSRRPMFGTLVTWRCELCGTVRYDVVQRMTGELLGRSYDHPDWYRAANEDGAEPAWWRAKYWESLDDSMFVEAEAKVTPIRKRRAS